MRLPPLNALRAFEAAARHEGFIDAAEELHVTRGAISRHVKLLEDHLGTALFLREARGVRLTAAGRQYQPVLAEAFAMMAREAARVSNNARDLRILCPPATSIRWLFPRLDRFRDRHPEIQVRLTTDFHGSDGFDSAEFDLGFSVERWLNRAPDLQVSTLFPVRLSPACAPSVIARYGPMDTPSDLAKVPLLHETPARRDWAAWLAEFAAPGFVATRQEDFPNLDMATRAATMGTGMVMADQVLNQEEFEAGTLITPFPDMWCDGPFGGVCLLGPTDTWDEPKVRAFRDWAAEMAETGV